MENLLDEILNLVSLKQEGGYWDFKKKWYADDNKGRQDMLHDIICMANNLENRDSYIIIGIDEENDYCISNVIDTGNRRNTQNMVDFLREKKFAGDQRPVVTVQSFEIVNETIDVMIIHNSYSTPYYLKEKFNEVCANNIYVRVQDTNTPRNKSADLQQIEYLWKKRFGMILTPLEKFQLYLKTPHEWKDSPSNDAVKYYKYSPEYTITHTYEAADGRNGYEYYLFSQTDSRPHWCDIQLKYHQTVLFETIGVMLDGGRYFTNVPLTEVIALDRFHSQLLMYKYFVYETMEYDIHKFYYQSETDDEMIAHDKFVKCVLFFDTEQEHQGFNKFILDNWKSKEKYSYNIYIPHMEPIEGYVMEAFEEEYRNVQIIRNMFQDYRAKTESII